MKIRNRRHSPALLVAILALIVGMSGSAFAIQRGQSGDSLINQRTLSGNRLRLNTVTGQEVADLVWHNLTLINGWESYNEPGVRTPAWAMDAQGIVHFRGAISQAAGSNNIFTRLPVAIRPAAFVYIATDLNIAATGRIYIQPNGVVHAEATINQTSAQSFTSLDGPTYAVH
jgi:hypothetical protein